MKKIAIIGAGVVGATAAYSLSKAEDVEVTIFDEGLGQATKAAAGIISPWFSKRRNKVWYKMARLGADFYPQLVADLKEKGFETDFYEQTGVYLLKKDEKKLAELYQLAIKRQQESPMIGTLQILQRAEVEQTVPDLKGFQELLYATGGGRVDGARLTKTLIEASGWEFISKKVHLKKSGNAFLVDDQLFDAVILATGAWLASIVEPLGYQVDVRPQKGQLRDYKMSQETDSYPVIMPEGEADIIPFRRGKVSLGATHENDKGFDLTIDTLLLDQLEEEASRYFPSLTIAERLGERVGIRAYTSDFSPFFGLLPEEKHLYVASGLGSSGLTTGPLIGHSLARMLQGKTSPLDPADYPVERYIQKR